LAFDAALGWGANASTNFGGSVPLKIWEGKKSSKIGAIYDSFRVRNISGIAEDTTQSKRR